MLEADTFTTRIGHTYLFNQNKKTILLMHPVLSFLYGNVNKLRILVESINEKGELTIPEYGRINKREFNYYLHKLEFLEQAGFFSDFSNKEKLTKRVTSNEVKYNLVNLRQISFEVTQDCNLKCKYCGQGRYFIKDNKKYNTVLSIKTAKNVIRYLKAYWNVRSNHAEENKIYVSFYGGEPLLNIRFIKEIVKYFKTEDFSGFQFGYAITTNGVLLTKHIDFLVKNNFHISISLDGDKKNNQYRIFPNGYNSFDLVFKNILIVKEQYPEFFKTNVDFLSVLHNKNSISEIDSFFNSTFNTKSRIMELNKPDISKELQEKFLKIFLNKENQVDNAETYYAQKNKSAFFKPFKINIDGVIERYGNSYHRISEVIYDYKYTNRVPSATCTPFEIKLFVTADGKILQCQNVPHKYALGYANDEKVELNTHEIANKINSYFDTISKMCSKCYNSESCIQCFYLMDSKNNLPYCHGFMNKQRYKEYLSNIMEALENNTSQYIDYSV